MCERVFERSDLIFGGEIGSGGDALKRSAVTEFYFLHLFLFLSTSLSLFFFLPESQFFVCLFIYLLNLFLDLAPHERTGRPPYIYGAIFSSGELRLGKF